MIIKGSDPTNDYGIYRCEVENEEGDTVGSAQSAVSVGYHSAAQAVEAKFDEEAEAVLQCPVFVVPGSVVTWSRQGDELPSKAEPKGNNLV